MSDRERSPQTFTPEFEAATLCAVLDELGLERLALMGISCGGCIAASFAANWPERVERLVLYGSYADGHALGPPEARNGMVELVRSHWGLGSHGPDPELFAAGRQRAQRARVELEWIAADAEDLPFEDDRFDYVLSSLGVQFAPRHEVVASELVRVCRPGATIALGNWAADGYIGRFWTIMGPYLPPPPDYASPPADWGRSEHVEELFAEYPVELTFERYALEFEADSAEAFLDTMGDFYGPLLQARNKLTATGRWEALRDQLIALSHESNVAGDGHFRAPSEYLVTLARKRT